MMPADSLASFVSGLSRTPQGGKLWCDERGEVAGRFLALSLASVFQPIRTADSLRIVGHEAFIRSHSIDGDGLSPWSLFAHAALDEQLIELDRTCRTLHAVSFFRRPPAEGDLLVNVHGRLLLAVREDHGRVFRGTLDSLQLPVERVVIESPEQLGSDIALLASVMQNYRRNGFRVAINMASVRQSQRLLHRFLPDLLKIDVRHLGSAGELAELAANARSYGVGLVVKRIQTPEQGSLARAGGADYVQGHVFDAESPIPAPSNAKPIGYPSSPPSENAVRTFLRMGIAQGR